MRFSVIAAAQTTDGGMGYQGHLPWSIKEDMQHFKKVTTTTSEPDMQNVVIMGKRTFESLHNKPLPNRYNIVLTSNDIEGITTAATLENALLLCPTNTQHIFVIGGARVYEEALRHHDCEYVYMTHVQQTQMCDVFFPLAVLADRFEEQDRRYGLGVIFSTYRRKI
jgi:dihydrofolate reductase